mgnify:CR=1 FL=1
MTSRAIVVARHAVVALLTVLAAHAASFALVNVLPATAQQLLGLAGWSPDLRRGFEEARPKRNYPTMLRGLARGDLGVTSDGVLVSAELASSASRSLPRIILALTLGLVAGLFAAWTTDRGNASQTSRWWLLTFFPPYGYSVLAAAFVLMVTRGVPLASAVPWMMCTLAAAASPMALLAGQARTVMAFHLSAGHSAYLRANGVSEQRIRRLCLFNVVAEMLPTIEKVVAGTLTGLVLAEFILGVPGLGLLTFRTVRRSDVEMLGGLVLFFAAVVATTRFAATMLASRDSVRR